MCCFTSRTQLQRDPWCVIRHFQRPSQAAARRRVELVPLPSSQRAPHHRSTGTAGTSQAFLLPRCLKPKHHQIHNPRRLWRHRPTPRMRCPRSLPVFKGVSSHFHVPSQSPTGTASWLDCGFQHFLKSSTFPRLNRFSKPTFQLS